jgi:ketosteroid isomerase-like protein
MTEVTTSPEMAASERLARRWFATVAGGRFDELAELVHDNVQIVSKVQAGTVVEGREDVARFIETSIAPNLYEAVTEVFTTLDDDRVVVEGRMRWIDDERVIRDDPVVWAMEFRDGLLLRFVPTRSVFEAETTLAAPR